MKTIDSVCRERYARVTPAKCSDDNGLALCAKPLAASGNMNYACLYYPNEQLSVARERLLHFLEFII